jgi:nitroreductase/NAD-dependent dihydropyrimidine dehydrogenase PreA subunit
MGLLTVDQSKCKKDGLCVRECPTGIIRLKRSDGYPALMPKSEQACLACGHCVAVCPYGAMSNARVPLEACPSIKKDLLIGPEQAKQFLRSRRSIRSFKNQPVERKVLQSMIETARYAPTASNAQTIQWMVFDDKEHIRRLSEMTVAWLKDLMAKMPGDRYAPYIPVIIMAWDKGMDRILRNAPALVVATAPRRNPDGMVDVALTLTYLDLIASTMGLGTCWAGLLHGAMRSWPAFWEEFPILESHPHHYPMMIGYTDTKFYRLPERNSPRIQWMSE